MTRSNTKSGHLYQQLWDELLRCAPGDRFLSIREIMQKYEVSQLVVDRTLTRLRNEQFLIAEGSRGLFVSEKIARFSTPKPPTVLCAVPRWASHDVMEMLAAFRALRPRFPEWRLLEHEFDFARPFPSALPVLEENLVGVVVHPAASNLDADEVARFRRLLGELPVVVFGRDTSPWQLPSACLDNAFAGSLAARHLHQHGHRQLALLLSEPHNRTTDSRAKGVVDYAALNELPLEIIDCQCQNGDYTPGKTYDHMCRRLREGFDFTGIVGVASHSLPGLLNACHNAGVSVPGALGVVTIGSVDLTRTFAPPLDTVEADLFGQIETALTMLRAGDSGNAALTPRLTTQGSVMPMDTSKGGVPVVAPAEHVSVPV